MDSTLRHIFVFFTLLFVFTCNGLYFDENNFHRASRESNQKSPAISAVLLECPKKNPTNCERQMMVNIRVSPSFNTEKTERYLVLDELYDQKKKSKAKIMSPYLIEISRGEPVVMYPLEFSKVTKNIYFF